MTEHDLVHGNAGSIIQGYRSDTYRNLASAAPSKIHVLSFDYRGFGKSSGSPSEIGLIEDGIAAVNWALNEAQIPPHRIVLVGQSLGTAVAAAVAEHFSNELGIDFAGLILCAAFTDLPSLVLKYAIGGIVPILSPLRSYPRLQKWFASHIVDDWQTQSRLVKLARSAKYLNLALIHAKDDMEISWQNSEKLFNATTHTSVHEGFVTTLSRGIRSSLERSRSVGWRDTWMANGTSGLAKKIEQIIVPYGGKIDSLHAA